MRATTERSIGVDQAPTGRRIEHWAGSVRLCRKFGAPGGAQGPRCDQRLAFRQVGSQAGELKLATLRSSDALSLHGSHCQLGVNLTDFGDRVSRRLVRFSVLCRHPKCTMSPYAQL